MKNHWDILNHEGLVSSRKPVLLKGNDGTVVEVFGWKSEEAIERAHSNEEVQRLWGEYAEVCDYVPIADVPECQ